MTANDPLTAYTLGPFFVAAALSWLSRSQPLMITLIAFVVSAVCAVCYAQYLRSRSMINRGLRCMIMVPMALGFGALIPRLL